jgi:biopolymer transport protein ExbD
MKLPRNVKIFRGQLDAAPFASVAFLLLIFLVLQSKLVFTPGLLLRIDVPEVPVDLAGTVNPTVVVAVDRTGQIYCDSQATTLTNLRAHLKNVVRQAKEPVTLEVQADKAASWETTAPLLSLAKEAGVREALIVTRPRLEPITKPRRK